MREVKYTNRSRFYAVSVLILTAAMWFEAWISGYNIGLDLRPTAAAAAAAVSL